MTIRQATPEDFDAIYSLVKTAFQTAKVSDGDEQDFVLKLRKGRYIPGYYGRFGFHSAASISYPGVPGEYTLACELTPGALRNISGAISLPDC